MHAQTDSTRFCEQCAVRDQALCSTLPSSVATTVTRIARSRSFPAGQVLQYQNTCLSWFATVKSGVIKLVKIQQDGRQQIVGLRFPADFFGRPYAASPALVAQAATNLELCCYSRRAFEQLIQRHPPLTRVLLCRVFDDLEAARQWSLLLGRKSPRERVASLLSSCARRLAQSPDYERAVLQFDLPFSRTEIADALGLTVETVSRQIRHLKSQHLIDLKGRRTLFVPHLAALEREAGGEQ